MSILRRTSTYVVEVRAVNTLEVLSQMILRCPVDLTASGLNRGVAYIRFRCRSDDNVALNLALEIAGGQPFTLHTGYGVNQREVTQ
jgi:hypothetical protein